MVRGRKVGVSFLAKLEVSLTTLKAFLILDHSVLFVAFHYGFFTCGSCPDKSIDYSLSFISALNQPEASLRLPLLHWCSFCLCFSSGQRTIEALLDNEGQGPTGN